jgi:hypothetical protein
MTQASEYEAEVMGILLSDWEYAKPILDRHGITADVFQSQLRRAAFKAAIEIDKGAHVPGVDLITVTDRLKQNGVGDRLGVDQLEMDCGGLGTKLHLDYYALELIAAARQRSKREIGQSLVDDCLNIADAIEQLCEIRDGDATQAHDFDCHTLSSLKAHKPDPRHFIAGDGWLKRGAGTLLTGGTGFGKSVLLTQIAVCVAAGVDILGCLKVLEPFRVMVVQAENDADVLKTMILSIVENLGPDEKLVQENLRIYHSYGMDGPALAEWLAPKMDEFKPDLLPVDPYQAYAGAINLNDTESFLRWRDAIEPLIRKHNCALLLSDHTPKPADRSKWNPYESVYLAAGSSAKANWARASAELTTIGQETERFRLRFGKNPATAGIQNEEGQMVTDLYLERSPSTSKPYWRVSPDQESPSKSELRDKVIGMAIKHPSMSQREIAKKLGCAVGTVNKYYPDSE